MIKEDKIPKIIHYCWFGGGEKNETVKKCIASWEKFCPGYKIIEWNEANYDLSRTNVYVKQAFKHKKWAFVADYARLDILYTYGGLYFDTDVELVRPPDELLKDNTFFGLEDALAVNTGIGCGSTKNAPVLKKIMEEYENISFIDKKGKINYTTCVEITSNLLIKYGLKPENKNQCLFVDDKAISIYNSEYFCPQQLRSVEINVTDKTISIHHYDGSWKSPMEYTKTTLKIFVRKMVDMVFGIGTYNKIKMKIKS